MTMETSPEVAWRVKAKFQGGDRWVYPEFRLRDHQDLKDYGGLLIRARAVHRGDVRVFLWEGDKGVGYLTAEPILPADGNWHTARVRFRDLVVSAANAPDPNGKLDLDQVRRISVGMNSRTDENSLEVSDLFLIREK